MKNVDFGRAAGDYAKHRAGFPPELFDRLSAQNIFRPGTRVLDVGTGTGTLARNFAARGCTVTALDPSRALLDQAARLAREASLPITFVEARAEATGLADASFDLISVGQAWHWLDPVRAGAELHRLLVPGGALLLAYFDWIPLPGTLADDTEALVEAHNPAWPHRGWQIFKSWSRFYNDVRAAGFHSVETWSSELDIAYTPEAWRGRLRACAGVGATLPSDQVATFDATLAHLLATKYPGDTLHVPHRISALIAKR